MIDFLATHAGPIGLVFFFVFFLAVLAWVFRPGSGARFKQYGNIPLKDGDK